MAEAEHQRITLAEQRAPRPDPHPEENAIPRVEVDPLYA